MSSHVLTLSIDTIPRSPNGPKGLLRMHWSKRMKYGQEWQWLVKAQKPQDFPTVERGIIQIQQYRKRLLDIDNLYASCKPVLDALVKCEIIRDDSPDRFALRVSQGVSKTTQTIIGVWSE